MKKGLEDKVDKVSLSTKVQSFEEVSRELIKVNDTLNTLLEKTTQTSEIDTTDGIEGEPGDIQTVLNSDKTYSFSIRTEDGWKSPHLKDQEITFKSKSKGVKEVAKSIDEIEAKDASDSTDVAKKTIYDKKADKFVLPRPDYDTGWLDMARDDGTKDNFTLAHGLTFSNSSPTLVIAWMKDAYGDKDGAAATNIIYPWKRFLHDTGGWRGADWRIDSTNLYIQAYTSYYIFWNYQDDSGGVGAHKYWNRIAGRILIWK